MVFAFDVLRWFAALCDTLLGSWWIAGLWCFVSLVMLVFFCFVVGYFDLLICVTLGFSSCGFDLSS